MAQRQHCTHERIGFVASRSAAILPCPDGGYSGPRSPHPRSSERDATGREVMGWKKAREYGKPHPAVWYPTPVHILIDGASAFHGGFLARRHCKGQENGVASGPRTSRPTTTRRRTVDGPCQRPGQYHPLEAAPGMLEKKGKRKKKRGVSEGIGLNPERRLGQILGESPLRVPEISTPTAGAGGVGEAVVIGHVG